MKSVEQNFRQDFETKLKPGLSDLESLRQKTALKAGLALAFWSMLFLSVAMFLTWKIYSILKSEFLITDDYEIILAGAGFLLFVYLVAGIYLNIKRGGIFYKYLYQGEYAARYRQEIVEKGITLFKEGLNYNPENGIPQSGFTQSGFPMFSHPKRYYSSGAITGKIGKTDFTFAEVLAEDLHEKSSEQYFDLFRGVFFVADFKKNTEWDTLVYPDTFKYFSSFLVGAFSQEDHFSKNKYSRIKLEDPEFENYFQVYGTDQMESRYVLSPALMARIVDFKKKTKKNIQFSFKNSKVYFGIHYPAGKSLFTPPLFSSVYDSKPLENYISDVQLMLDVIEELNLNSQLIQELKQN